MAFFIGGEGGYNKGNSSTEGETKKNSNSNTSYTGSTSGSTNTTQNSGSQNTIVNSGSINTSTKGASTVTVGPSTNYNISRTSDQVNTSQLMLTEDAVNYMVKGILEGTSGLANTLGGGLTAGIYNASTTSLLGNDLVARTAGEVAARAAVTKTVIGGTTTTNTGYNSGYTTRDSGYNTYESIGSSSTTQNIGASSSTQNIGGTTTSGSTNANTVEEAILNSNTKSSEASSKAKAGWIVCTELMLQGKLNKRHWYYGVSVFSNYDEATRRGYYFWAIPARLHVQNYPESKLTRFLQITLGARAEYISAEQGCSGAKKTFLGFICKHLRWGCWILGHTVARKSPNSVPVEVNNVWTS